MVRLRSVVADDLPLFFANQADAGAARLVAFTSRTHEAFMAHWSKLLADPAVTVRTILTGDEVAGHVACFPRDGALELGYWLDRRFWGRGIASLAIAEFLRLVPERPLRAVIAHHNPASFRVVEKCGFVVRGVVRDEEHGVELQVLVLD